MTKLDKSIEEVNKKFKWVSDRKSDDMLDSWRICRTDSEGNLIGDCEDYSLTVIFEYYDRDWKKFIWFYLILGRFMIYTTKTENGTWHAITRHGDVYFDNWTKRPLDRNMFFKQTGHSEKILPMLQPIPAVLMLYSKVVRCLLK